MHPVKDCEKLKQPTSSHGQIQNIFSMLARSIGQKEKKPYDSYMLGSENFIQEKSYLNLI